MKAMVHVACRGMGRVLGSCAREHDAELMKAIPSQQNGLPAEFVTLTGSGRSRRKVTKTVR